MIKASHFIIFPLIILACTKHKTSEPIFPEEINQQSPNIVFIIADDMGWDVFGKYPGIEGIKANTPTIDSLAKNGISFTNFWVNPECAPTRAALLTGKYAFRTGIGGVQAPQTAILKSSEVIIQKYINDKTSNAYATAVIGKWHVSGNTPLIAPETFGVNYYSGFLSGSVSDYYNWTETSNGVQRNITDYATTRFVDNSVSWIQKQTKPFFLWLAFNAPHTPFHRPPLNLIKNQSLSASVAAINADQYNYYLASIQAMDKEISRLITSLSVSQRENTVFVFIGDNGTPTQVAQGIYKKNGTKSTLFQGGINTPLIVSGKNVSRKNVVETALIQAPDMFATIADIAGAGNENYQDAVSFKKLLSDGTAPKRSFVYSEFFGSSPSTNDGFTLRNETYKYISLENGKEYFFDLVNDPFEKSNLLTSTLSNDAQQNLDKLKTIKSNL